MKALSALLVALLLAGCNSTGLNGSPLIPDKTIQLTSATSISLAKMASGAFILGAVYLVYDPLAPNWEIEESRLAEDTFRLSLKMKRYHTGGAGESLQALRRRAVQLQSELGYGGYQLAEYSEGIESQTLGARRVAEGTIKLVKRQAADSFLQNER